MIASDGNVSRCWDATSERYACSAAFRNRSKRELCFVIGWGGSEGARAGDLAAGLDNELAARTPIMFYSYLYSHMQTWVIPRIASSHTIKP